MASQSGQRIRLVKCPKCLKILQEDEDVPVYRCGGCSAILQAKKRSIAPNITPSETEVAQSSKPETNNVSSSSGQDTVLPSSPGPSSVQEDEKAGDRYTESIEKLFNRLELSNREERNEIQLVDSDKNEGEDNSNSRLKLSDTKAAEPGTSSGSLSAEHIVDARPSNPSSDAYRKPEGEEEEQNKTSSVYDGSGEHVVDARPSNSSSDAFHKLEGEISPDAFLEEQNKTCSDYDGSESSSDERVDQWNALEALGSDKLETHRYAGESSSSTFSDKWRDGPRISSVFSLQLEGPGGRRVGRQGRRNVTEQLRPPFYPREPSYTRGSPSYPSNDEFDRYSRAQSLQMYGGNDYMYHNNVHARGRGQESRFSRIPYSAEMTTNERRHHQHPGWYSGQIQNSNYSSYTASPQRPMEQQPRWSREIVPDQRSHNHQRELQRQLVAKRHVRPTAGGAPFVNCYRCSENLQLPVDFLIFKKKHHLLRCGTCTTVLRFSLGSRNHLVPAVTHSNSKSESPRYKPEKLSSSLQKDEDSSPVARGSPLHRLMGYSSVSQVFKSSQRPPSL